MSFSGEVKQEAAGQIGHARHCLMAELSALISSCGRWKEDLSELTIRTESEIPRKKVFTLLQKTFNMRIEADADAGSSKPEPIRIEGASRVSTILSACGLIHRTADGWENLPAPEERITARSCCKRAFIRGSFLGVGSVNDPQKTYHLEFVFDTQEKAEQLKTMLSFFDVEAHTIVRKRGGRSIQVVYIKDGAQIADVLNIIGGHAALLRFEDIRVVKDVRNQVNRQVNCEAANLNRIVSAAVRQLEDIRLIEEKIGLDNLPPVLKETAQLRLDNADASLQELSAMLGVGKSGVNHRFRKLTAMAELIREEMP